MAKLSDVLAEIARQTTVEQSVRALLGSLSQQIADLKNTGGATPEQLDSLLAGIKANTDDMASAVAANTPADPNQGQPTADPNTPNPGGSPVV